MTTAYDPEIIARLVAEAREDDARMTPAPWRYDHRGWIESMDRGINHTGAVTEVLTLGARNEHDDGDGTSRQRNNLRAMADQLDAARTLIDRMRNDAEVGFARRHAIDRENREQRRADDRKLVKDYEAKLETVQHRYRIRELEAKLDAAQITIDTDGVWRRAWGRKAVRTWLVIVVCVTMVLGMLVAAIALHRHLDRRRDAAFRSACDRRNDAAYGRALNECLATHGMHGDAFARCAIEARLEIVDCSRIP